MGDMADDFRALREHNREQRAQRRDSGELEIEALEREGFTVQELTPYHFRVNQRLDLFPTHRRFHDLKTGRRGRYQSAFEMARAVLG